MIYIFILTNNIYHATVMIVKKQIFLSLSPHLDGF